MHEDSTLSQVQLTEKKWIAYFESLLQKASEEHVELCTPFADPRQQQISGDIARNYPDLRCAFLGGTAEAERARICISPFAELRTTSSQQVSCLEVRGKFPAQTLTHRDFLGAVLSLGIRREMVGDIYYPGADTAYILLCAELGSYVLQHLQEVGRYKVQVRSLTLEDLARELPPRRVKEVKGTVPSLRIDAVAGLGFGLSRSKIAPLIRGGQVKVNHQLVSQPSRPVAVGDMISLAGKGRIELVSSQGKTRKGRTHLVIHRLV